MYLEAAEGLSPELVETLLSEEDWQEWLRTLFAPYVSDDFDKPIPFAPHHEKLWQWVWALGKGFRPSPFIAVWPRGGAKSTNMEMACVAVGAMKKRRYVWYTSGTQDQADDHVQNVADMLEASSVEMHYPDMATRLIGKFGNAKGWRRNRLRTASGFTVDAIGLDKAARGGKLEEDRPDFIIFDDLDEESDSPKIVEKKIRSITRKIVPAGAEDLAVLGGQNLVHEDSIFSRLVDGRADFLMGRIVSGPIRAVENLEYEEEGEKVRITGGTPTWEGMNLSRCEEMASDMGLEAFLAECQHEVEAVSGIPVFSRNHMEAAFNRGKEVQYNPQAAQFVGLDPGYARRASMLCTQENSGDRIEMWAEHSFTRMIDHDIAEVVATHCVNHHVLVVYFDAEAPELGAAVQRALDKRGASTRVQAVPFNRFKRLSIKTTRWLLKANRISWKGETTTEHTPGKTARVPSIFKREMVRYVLEPDKDDEPVKQNDHGPDAFTAYMSRWIKSWASSQEAA